VCGAGVARGLPEWALVSRTLPVFLSVWLSWSSDPPRAWWSESESYRRVGLFARMLLFLEVFEMVVLCRARGIVVAWNGFGVLL
jgi:hypothetical protein